MTDPDNHEYLCPDLADDLPCPCPCPACFDDETDKCACPNCAGCSWE